MENDTPCTHKRPKHEGPQKASPSWPQSINTGVLSKLTVDKTGMMRVASLWITANEKNVCSTFQMYAFRQVFNYLLVVLFSLQAF